MKKFLWNGLFYVGLAVGAWVLTDSLLLSAALLLFWFLAAAGFWSIHARRSSNSAIRYFANGYLLVLCGGILSCFGLDAEHLYFVNCDSYPSWLAKGDFGNMTEAQIYNRYDALHCEGGNIIIKPGNQVVMRCGGPLWTNGPTFIAHRIASADVSVPRS